MDDRRAESWVRHPGAAFLALVWAAMLLGGVSAAPAAWLWLLPQLGPSPLVVLSAAGALAIGALLLRTWFASARRRPPALATILVGAALSAVLLFGYYRGEKVVKRMHLAEYAGLSLLAFEAVRVSSTRLQTDPAAIRAALFVFAVGTCDEVAQRFVPGRTFRWHDLGGNYLAAALGILFWMASSPASPWRRPDPE